MLYTRKGDGGTTKTFGCNQKISKSSTTAEALGSLDEINSFLGLCKVASEASGYKLLAFPTSFTPYRKTFLYKFLLVLSEKKSFSVF